MNQKTNSSENVRKLAITAILAALVVVLQIIGGIPIGGGVAITLTLVPIVVGAIILGAPYGAFLGGVFGVVTIAMVYAGKDPASMVLFEKRPVAACAICLLKGALAGLLPAIVHKLFDEKKFAPHVLVALSGAFIAAAGFMAGKMSRDKGTAINLTVVLLVALAAAGYLLLVRYALHSKNSAVCLASMVAPIANTGVYILGMMLFFSDILTESAGGKNIFLFLVALIALNFIIEFTVSVVLSPAVAVVIKKAKKDEASRQKKAG